MTIGAFSVREDRSRIFSLTKPYLPISVHFACPVGVPYSSIERITMPFSNEIWICVVVYILVASIYLFMNKSVYYDNKLKRNAVVTIVCDVWDLFLNGQLHIRTRRNSARFMLIVWVLMTFVLRNIYLASLFHLLQAQVNDQAVDTIERIIEYKYTVYTTPATYELLYRTVPALRGK